MEETVKVTKNYATKRVERKFMEDAIKANKFATAKRRRLKKGTVTEE